MGESINWPPAPPPQSQFGDLSDLKRDIMKCPTPDKMEIPLGRGATLRGTMDFKMPEGGLEKLFQYPEAFIPQAITPQGGGMQLDMPLPLPRK